MAQEFDITVDAEVDELESHESGGTQMMASTDHYPDEDDSDMMYASAEKAASEGRTLYSKRGDSADEIDPRKLVRDPTLSELRWYYRRTFAKKLVNKPIDDAFKHGFRFEGADATTSQEYIDEVDYIHDYKLAEKKARRDGFSLIFMGTRDTSGGVHISPYDDGVKVMDITHTKVLTIDDLCHCADHEVLDQIQESYDLELGDFRIRRTGIVVNTDIGSPDYRQPIGYVLYQGPNDKGEDRVQFIHRDRVQHLVWNEEVDGDYRRDDVRFGTGRRWYDERPLGEWEGDSILVQSYDLMKGIAKGDWAIMQALFRNAANLYAVHLPNDATEEEFNSAKQEFKNLNAKSELFLPAGPPASSENSYEIKQYTSGDMVEPREYFEVIFDQICATHEMTKSVLFGTQSGTVSGSETDIKNYFNKVERYRQTRATNWILDFVNRCASLLDGRRDRDSTMLDVEVDWEALFKLTDVERVNAMQSLVSAMNVAINGFVLTPDEARSILNKEWAFAEYDNLSDEDLELLYGLNTQQPAGHPTEEDEDAEYDNPSMRQGGGMEQGQKTSEIAPRE